MAADTLDALRRFDTEARLRAGNPRPGTVADLFRRGLLAHPAFTAAEAAVCTQRPTNAMRQAAKQLATAAVLSHHDLGGEGMVVSASRSAVRLQG